MWKYIIKYIPSNVIWKEIFRREGFVSDSFNESSSIWQDAFSRVPILKNWLQKREMNLLKSMTLGERDTQFILGQIAENRIIQHFDVPGMPTQKVDLQEVIPEIDEKSFLSRWTSRYAANKIGEEGNGKHEA